MTFPSAERRSSTLWIRTESGRQFLMCCNSWSVVLLGTKRPWRFPAEEQPTDRHTRSIIHHIWAHKNITRPTLTWLSFITLKVLLHYLLTWCLNFNQHTINKNYGNRSQISKINRIGYISSPTHILPMIRHPAIEAWTTGIVSDSSPSKTLWTNRYWSQSELYIPLYCVYSTVCIYIQ